MRNLIYGSVRLLRGEAGFESRSPFTDDIQEHMSKLCMSLPHLNLCRDFLRLFGVGDMVGGGLSGNSRMLRW